MHFADVALSKEKLASLWSYAFSRDARGREHRGLRHLALGLAGALGQPGARLQVASSGWGFQLQGLDTPRLKPKKARELWLKIDARFTRVLSTQELLQRFGHSATRLVVAGQAAPQGSKTQPDGRPFWLQPDVREDWQLVVDDVGQQVCEFTRRVIDSKSAIATAPIEHQPDFSSSTWAPCPKNSGRRRLD